MNEQLREFLMSPSRDLYLEIRETVIGSPSYEPYSDEFANAVKALDDEEFETAREILQQGMPNLLLSPRAHHMLSIAHHKAGDFEAAKFEFAFADACVQGILATGDGSAEHPYLVIRTSDEYDVLDHLGKNMTRQTLAEADERRLDVISCGDGTRVCFDITDAYNQLM